MAAVLTNLWKRITKNDIDKWVELVEHPSLSEVFAIKIKKGTYKDVVYFYGKVNFIETNGNLVLKYETTVLENPRKHNIHSNKFKKITGDILSYYLSQSNGGNSFVDTDYLSGGNDVVLDESGD